MKPFTPAIALAVALALSACAMPQMVSESPPPVPRADATPIDVAYAKLIQAAFVDEYAGKTVRFAATYMGPTSCTLLPAEYQQDYVCIITSLTGQDVDDLEDIVVPKHYANATFALKKGTYVRITAYAQLSSGLLGRGLWLIADSILPIEATSTHKKKHAHPRRESEQ